MKTSGVLWLSEQGAIKTVEQLKFLKELGDWFG